jgi:hypothetical protein
MNPMRLGVVVVAVVAVMGIAACGGNEEAAAPTTLEQPITLEERVPGEAEAPGSEPDPVETRVTVVGLEELVSNTKIEEQLITVTDEDVARVEEDGFVAAILDTRFFPSEPGGEHGPGVPHVGTLVMQFDSAEGATDAVDLLHTDGLEPCPETCAFDIAEFEVDGIPNAKGVQRIATQEALDQVGDEHPPHAEYTIRFADGPFAYDVTLFGPPDQVSEQQAEEIVTKLYERVQGAPPSPQG